jgi:hypothetical protein
MEDQLPYLNEWLQLARSGNFEKAQEIYFEKLFAAVIDNFRKKYKTNSLQTGGILFSVLGFSPEPIILTAKIVEPQIHVIFATNNQSEGNIYLEKYLEANYEMVYLPDEKFDTIYKALKEQLYLTPSSQITLDITGGKKSMVAAA